MSPLRKAFFDTYTSLAKRANVKPGIYSLAKDHHFYDIDAGDGYKLKGFYLAPDFVGKINYCPDDIYIDLFRETGLGLSNVAIGMVISWCAFQELIMSCRKSQDEIGEHIFTYLLKQLDKAMSHHKDERLIGLTKQTIEFYSPAPFIPKIVKN